MPLTLPTTDEDELDPEFVLDVKVLCGEAHFKHLEDYVDLLFRLLAEAEEIDPGQAVETFAEEHGKLEIPNVERCVRLLNTLARKMVEEEGWTSEAFLDLSPQLAAYFEDGDETAAQLGLLISLLEPRKQEIARLFARGVTIAGLMPMLQNITATVDARVLWEGEGGGQPRFFPVATVLLDFDGGTPDRICFQTTPARLRALIARLKELEGNLGEAASAARNLRSR